MSITWRCFFLVLIMMSQLDRDGTHGMVDNTALVDLELRKGIEDELSCNLTDGHVPEIND